MILYERLEEDCVRRDWSSQAAVATSSGRNQPEGRHGGNELEAAREFGQGIGDLGTCV